MFWLLQVNLWVKWQASDGGQQVKQGADDVEVGTSREKL